MNKADLSACYFNWRGWGLILPALILLAFRIHVHTSLQPLWLLLIIVAASLRLFCGFYIEAHTNNYALSEQGLCQKGPYSFSRNPLYLANILNALGLIGFVHCTPWFISLLLITWMLLHHIFLIKMEEDFLENYFGEIYLMYKKNVPRWLGFSPMRNAFSESWKSPYPFRQAFKSQGGNILKNFTLVFLFWISA